MHSRALVHSPVCHQAGKGCGAFRGIEPGWSIQIGFQALGPGCREEDEAAGILLDSVSKQGFYRNFIVRRTLRIFPLYYVTLALAGFLVYVLGNIQWRQFLMEQGGWWFATYLGNFYVLQLNSWPDSTGRLRVDNWLQLPTSSIE